MCGRIYRDVLCRGIYNVQRYRREGGIHSGRKRGLITERVFYCLVVIFYCLVLKGLEKLNGSSSLPQSRHSP